MERGISMRHIYKDGFFQRGSEGFGPRGHERQAGAAAFVAFSDLQRSFAPGGGAACWDQPADGARLGFAFQ